MAANKQALPVYTIRKLYVARKNGDTYETPRYFSGVREIGIEKTVNTNSFYAEGQLWASNSVLAEIPVTISLVDLFPEDEAYILGYKLSDKGGIIRDSRVTAPEVAILYTEEKSDGTIDCNTLFSGQFAPGGKTSSTAEGSPNYQAKTLSATFKPLESGITDHTYNVANEAAAETFFETVEIPTPKTETPAEFTKKNK